MSSQYVKDLYLLADQLDNDGDPASARTAREGAKHMDRMEDTILEIVMGVRFLTKTEGDF